MQMHTAPLPSLLVYALHQNDQYLSNIAAHARVHIQWTRGVLFAVCCVVCSLINVLTWWSQGHSHRNTHVMTRAMRS